MLELFDSSPSDSLTKRRVRKKRERNRSLWLNETKRTLHFYLQIPETVNKTNSFFKGKQLWCLQLLFLFTFSIISALTFISTTYKQMCSFTGEFCLVHGSETFDIKSRLDPLIATRPSRPLKINAACLILHLIYV